MVKALYQQVMGKIKKEIIEGKYPINSKLPSEAELQKNYSISRVTLRKAVDGLVNDDYVVRIQGKGTYVKQQRKIKRLNFYSAIESFDQVAKENGFTPHTKVISVKECKEENSEVKEDFTGNALNVKRVQYANDDPIIIENKFYPLPRFEKLKYLDLTGSIYKQFYEIYGIKELNSKKTVISMTLSTYAQSKLLGCSVGFPLFLVYSVIVDEEGQIVQVGQEFILSNRYRFVV